MPRGDTNMALTDLAIKRALPGAKIVKLSDGGGLQLWITPDGAKRWRIAYRFGGSQKTLAVGVYPDIGLKDARDAREAARKTLARGEDPLLVKKSRQSRKGRSRGEHVRCHCGRIGGKEAARQEGGGDDAKVRLVHDLRLSRAWLATDHRNLGARGLSRPQGGRGARHARNRPQTRTAIGDVFRFAIATARADNDPTIALRGALVTPTVMPRAAIIAPKAFGGLLRAIEDYEGTPETRAALELLALTFVRPGELRAAEWAEFDLDAAVWEIPAGRMKMRKPHRVPLAPRAVSILKELRKLTGQCKFLFPSVRSVARCMSENTLNAALRRMGFKNEDMTSHGFRASASSMLNESGLWNADAIERQLAHVDGDSVRRAYARAEFWDERVKMMTWWADRCDELRRN